MPKCVRSLSLSPPISTLTFKEQGHNVLPPQTLPLPSQLWDAYVYLVVWRQQRDTKVGSHLSSGGFVRLSAVPPLSDLPAHSNPDELA